MPRHHEHLLKVQRVIVVDSGTARQIHDFDRERLVVRRIIKTALGHNPDRNFLLSKREILHC